MSCVHDLAEKETACADGYCPICLAEDNDGMPQKLLDVAFFDRVIAENESLLTESSVLWDTLEHIAKMTGDKYCLGNATSLAQFAVDSRKDAAQVDRDE